MVNRIEEMIDGKKRGDYLHSGGQSFKFCSMMDRIAIPENEFGQEYTQKANVLPMLDCWFPTSSGMRHGLTATYEFYTTQSRVGAVSFILRVNSTIMQMR